MIAETIYKKLQNCFGDDGIFVRERDVSWEVIIIFAFLLLLLVFSINSL